MCPQFIVCVPSFYVKEMNALDRAAFPVWCWSLCRQSVVCPLGLIGSETIAAVLFKLICISCLAWSVLGHANHSIEIMCELSSLATTITTTILRLSGFCPGLPW